MQHFFLLFFLFTLTLYAEHNVTNSQETNTTIDVNVNAEPEISEETSTDTNESTQQEEVLEADDTVRPDEDIMVVKDESGLSDDAIRTKAKAEDTKKKVSKVTIEDVVENTDEQGNVDISKIQKKWENLSPTPVKYDWVKSKSGEWFKGEIKALFDDKLEFDSDEIGLYVFDFDDVVEIKSYHIISVNIENLATFPGIMRMKNNKITIVQGEHSYDFDKKDVISFAPDGEYERNYWSAKVSFSYDVRKGNTNQTDYSAKGNIKRRTADSRLSFDYLGRVSVKNGAETSNDHRLSQKYDIYLTRHYFWTPLSSEYYTDPYKNINMQLTAGVGVGYTLYDKKDFEWTVSSGPAAVFTNYVTVTNAEANNVFSPALEVSTKLDMELTSITDLKYSYKMTLTDKNAGQYKHHMLLTFENELLSWLDFDITGIWDYIKTPEQAADGTVPQKSDFQLLLGIGIEF